MIPQTYAKHCDAVAREVQAELTELEATNMPFLDLHMEAIYNSHEIMKTKCI